jgi:hypothetical protein
MSKSVKPAYIPFHALLFFFFIALMISPARSQLRTGNNIIKGKIIDSETKTPIPFAIVFLKNTTIGASADQYGNFEIKDIPSGDFELICSQAGYLMQIKKISLYNGTSIEYEIFLSSKVIPVNEVEVLAHSSEEWKKNLEIFTEQFIGSTQNSHECRIINPEVIDFIYNSKTDIFKAETDSIIIIENRALGYNIHLKLSKFIYNIHNRIVNYYFYPRYNELKTTDQDEIDKWNKNRSDCYAYSLPRFLKSLIKNEFEDEGFILYGGTSVSNLKNRFCERLYNSNIKIVPIKETNCYEVNFGFPFIKTAHFPKGTTNPRFEHLVSMIELKTENLVITGNGEVSDPDSIRIYGFWGTLRLADTLPIEYEQR